MYTKEARKFFKALYNKPSRSLKRGLNNRIKMLKKSGAWDKMDEMFSINNK